MPPDPLMDGLQLSVGRELQWGPTGGLNLGPQWGPQNRPPVGAPK